MTRGNALLVVLSLATRGAVADLPVMAAGASGPASAYLVVEITDLAAPRPAPFRMKALARRDGRAIARVLWPEGGRGVTLLVTPEDFAAYFPRADLLVASPRGRPQGMSGELAGDLAGALADAAVPAPANSRLDRCAGAPCLRWERALSAGGPCARLLAWKRPDGSPIRAACLNERGSARWEIRFGDAKAGRGRFEWLESGRTRARGRIVFYEPGAPALPDLFTREGLRRWR
jgi:hypothetical protein